MLNILGAGRADVDDLPMQTLHQRSVLCFRVADDNIIVCHEECIANFTLCAERLAGAGAAENKSVGVYKTCTVEDNQIVGGLIQSVVNAAFLRQLL